MSILAIIKKNRTFLLLMALLGLVNSLLYSSLLYLINNGIRAEKDFDWMHHYEVYVFGAVIVISFISRRYFQNSLMKFSSEVLFKFTVSILNKIRFASFESFSKLGNQRIYTAIGDIKVVANLPRFFVDACNNVVVVICGLGYLFLTSPTGMVLTLVVTGLLAFIYWWRNEAIAKDLNRLRDKENDFYRYLADLLDGFREVKMSTKRNENLFWKYLNRNRDNVKNLEISTNVRYMDNDLFSSYGWFIVLGTVIFVLPMFQTIDYIQQTTFVVVVLYLVGPIGFVVNSFDFMTRFGIAQERLVEFHNDLGNILEENKQHKSLEIGQVEQISFEDITYTYNNERNGRQFTLDPVNLKLKKGETVFVVGENGSGKSTFMMLLSGLFAPHGGAIKVNDKVIRKEDLPQYRNLFSSIFTDAHLFSENYDEFDISKSNHNWQEFVAMMQLQEVIKVDNLKMIADSKLSKGQQKRLLLMYSLMEQKDVILLDEWAAEQDPTFRSIFYNHILKYLKDQGKTIIAITHDDRYFHLADRVITFHDGAIDQDLYHPTPAQMERTAFRA
ncbi:MAG: cyclic peptide export ABC transporter [Bacteroidota bacterium]